MTDTKTWVRPLTVEEYFAAKHRGDVVDPEPFLITAAIASRIDKPGPGGDWMRGVVREQQRRHEEHHYMRLGAEAKAAEKAAVDAFVDKMRAELGKSPSDLNDPINRLGEV